MFIRMKESLLKVDTNTRHAVKLLRSDFLTNIDPVYVTENNRNLDLFLMAEGVLIPGEEAGTFKISLPLVRWLVLQQIIPQVFPSYPKIDVPYHSSPCMLDILRILKQTICIFDKEIMSLASIRSSKKAHVNVDNVKNQGLNKAMEWRK